MVKKGNVLSDNGKVLPKNTLAIQDLIESLKAEAEQEAYPYLQQGALNEQWVAGRQTKQIGMNGQQEVYWRAYLPHVTKNLLPSLLATWRSAITSGRPSVGAWPAVPNEEAQESADVANKLITYYENEWQIDTLLGEQVTMAAMHGTAGFKIVFNPQSNSVEWNPITIFDILIDNTSDRYEEANWVMFKSYMDKWDAQELMGNEEVAEEEYTVNDSAKKRGVCVWELWHKPTKRVPQGLYCKLIQDKVIDAQAFPYEFANLESGKAEYVLPIVLMKVAPVRGSPFANTWVSDAVQVQHQINEIESSIMNIRRATANVKLVVPDKKIQDNWSADNQIIVSDASAGRGIYWVQPPVANMSLLNEREEHKRTLYEMAGLNEQLWSSGSVKSGTSGKSIAYLKALDAQARSGVTQSLEAMLNRAWKLTLQLIQKYYVGERVINIVDGDEIQQFAFKAADIQGITVTLSPREGYSRMPASVGDAAIEDAQQGLIPKEQALETRQTGQVVQLAADMARKIVHAQIDAAMQGQLPIADTSINTEDALDAATKIKAILVRNSQYENPVVAQAVDAVIEVYQTLLAPPEPVQPAVDASPLAQMLQGQEINNE